MKKVWKCDFCTDTNVDKEKVKEHEDSCVFNPKNKSCHTCEFFEVRMSEYCAKDVPNWTDVFYGDKKCDKWRKKRGRQNEFN